jgi:hypothetical protein
LPDEILLRIFGFIIPTDKRIDHKADPLATWGPEKTTTRDYLSLALTCRKLRPAATTMLYCNYDHNFERLIAKPELAAMVKDIKEVCSLTGIWRPKNIEPRNRSSGSIQAMCSAISNLQIPGGDAYNALFRPDEDRFYSLESALILFLTPNIEKLALNGCLGLEKPAGNNTFVYARREPQAALLPLLHAAQGVPYGRVHQSKCLKTLKLCMSGLHMNSVSSILRLGSLRNHPLSKYRNH